MQNIIAMLKEMEFEVPSEFPDTGFQEALRPDAEIARRLMVVKAVSAWVCAPRERIPDQTILEAVSRLHDGGARPDLWLGARERSILNTPREAASSVYLPWVGWIFEGAWALAFVLGYDEAPDIFGTMMDNERVQGVLFQFLPAVETDADTWLTSIQHLERFTDEAVAVLRNSMGLVDSASRSTKRATPAWFHRIHHGRVVMERHRALAWALLPNSTWDEVYLREPK